MSQLEVAGEYTQRGFFHTDPVETSYGAVVRLYESSSAEGPHIWLALDQPEPKYGGQLPKSETHAHMSLEEAELIHAQLEFFIEKAKREWGA